MRIVMALYSSLQCAVMWNGTIGHRFDVTCGVRQGGVLFCLPISFLSM